mgnify:CR=1 FL=1
MSRSFLKFFKPFFIFGIAATVLLIIFSLFLGPSGMRYTKFKIHEIRHDLSGTLVRDGMFSMPAKGLTVYAHKKDNNTSIDGILVHDNRDLTSTVTYSAEKGYLINDNNNPKLILLNGNIQYRNLSLDGPGMTTVSFEKNEYKLDVEKGVMTRDFIYSDETYEKLRLNDTRVEKENSNTKGITKVDGQIISEISGYPAFYTQMIFDTFDKTIKIKSVLNNTEGISVVSKCEKIIKYKLES